MKKINWLDHLVNLFVVIAGITIAFAMNNWKSDNDRDQLEQEYFKRFIVDLHNDIKELDSLIIDDSTQINAMNKLILFDPENDLNENGLLTNEMGQAVNRLAYLNTFTSQNTTFQSLVSSGKLDVIKGFDIKMELLDHYHNNLNTLSEVEQYYRKSFDNNILPFAVKNFSELGSNPEKVLNTRGFDTMIQVHNSLLQQRNQAIRSCRKSALKLKEHLNQLLNQ